VVVDDADMQITHVIRGDDHLNNTPRQMNMYQCPRCRGTDICALADDPGRRWNQTLKTPWCG
jgi:hypothetical protein